jgi:ribosomal protein L21E
VSFLGKRVIVHHQNYEGREGQIIGLEKDLWLIALDQPDEHQQVVILALKPQECQLID